jgi:ribonuclease D
VKASTLAGLLGDPTRTKFFHAAGGDLQYLAAAGVRVKGLFDTHRAVTLLGTAKVGLADLVLERLGQTLKKEHQQSDFSIRPLPPEVRAYIADDVRYLTDVGRLVREECRTRDILEEVLLDCERMCDEAAALPEVGSDYKPKLPRAGLSPAQVALATVAAGKLHALRLKLAEAANVPIGRMLSNAAIAAIATTAPADLKALQRCEGVRGAFAREHGEDVLALVHATIEQGRAGALPEADEKKDKDPKRRKREEALLDWRKAVAAQRKVTPSVVLPNSLLGDVVQAAPVSLEALAALKYFGARRLELYGSDVLAVLARLA